jgi:hypothetical protein
VLGASAVPVSTLEPMATRAVETPIGTLGIDASEAGLRRVRLPGEHERSRGVTAQEPRTHPQQPSSWRSTRVGTERGSS